MLNLLIRLRKEKGLNQSDLGKLIGKNQRTISKYEIEESELPVSVAKRIAEVFDVDWWKLYE
ncbi:helix-turn-helix transcriptional regulator [Finegoldia magna]|jgi:transcriptional regulator with XRE-family HTH domain|uniref:helix-turn-helix transcriptional regulator n=1 Tax=Finegoldia magna TaxID=1260 RepID=UPI0028064542|nr:helix-turn-helix transcriptional regulator [Finegoldia magna]MDU5071110.1 helix-turn-helix transcriptional regulator [Finegoldia magna]MDU5272024.1 helix-turn-helix transcriptional regulator [Finegoldia magna]